MTYTGLADWLAENLRRYAENHLRERLLVFTTVFRPDAVLAPMLLHKVKDRHVWSYLYRDCLEPRLEAVITGCRGDCEEFDEAMRCIDERLGRVIEEVTPWSTLDEFARKSLEALRRLYGGEGSDTEANR